MKTGKFYESEYEKGVRQLMQEAGWQYSHGGTLSRQTSQTLYEPDLRRYLAARYEDLTPTEIEAIVANLRNIGEDTLYHTLRATFTTYRDGFLFQRHDSDEKIHVSYIDFDHPGAQHAPSSQPV